MNESIKRTTRLSTIAYLAVCAVLCALAPGAHAIQASPELFEEAQPDGTRVKLRIRGDETFNWLEDENGFTVVRSRNAYVYGRLGASGRVEPTSNRVGRVDPAQVGLSKGIMPSPAVLQQLRASKPNHATGQSTGLSPGGAPGPAGGPEMGPPPFGVRKNLVVLVRFANHTTRPLPTQQDFNTLFNAVGGHPTLAPTGSVRDYYLENSYGQLTLNSTVLDWVTVPQTEAYYANGVSGDSTLWQALIYALNAADATIDFSDFDEDNDGRIDAIAFVHSGYAAEFGGTDAYGTNYTSRIWSHKWAIQPQWNSADGVSVFDYHINPGVWSTSGSAIGRIGVICHETGHFFGLPDLYDTDSTPGEGIGSWGLMANSWGFDGTQYYPPHMCSWSKIQLGWVTPTVISTPGTYELQQYETNPEVFRIDAGFPSNEYLLIENRQPVGFEAAMPQGGLCILHIDDQAGYNTQGYPGQTGWPQNGNHYRVAVLQADGLYELERGNNRGDGDDPYHAGGVDLLGATTVPNTDAYQGGNVFPTGNTIYNISASGPSMTFDYSAEELNVFADITLSEPSLGFAVPAPASANKTLAIGNAADSGGQDLDYFIQATVDGYEEDVVGSLTFGASGTLRYRGNIFQATSNTTLLSIEAALNITGTVPLTFVVYDMPGLASTDVKTRIFELTGTVAGAGQAFYGTGPISVPLQAGRYYGIAAGWSTASITYIWDQNAQPAVSFGSKVRAFAYDQYPLPQAFTGNLGTNLNNYYQRLTVGSPNWLSVDVPLGSVAPQGSQNAVVTANATGFAPGTYSGELNIFSNDQDESLLSVPIGLLVGLQGQIYIDFSFTGTEFGTMANPYNTVAESLQAVQASGTVNILGGGFSPEVLDIGQNVTINAIGEEATIGAPGPSPVGQSETAGSGDRLTNIQPAAGQARAVSGLPSAISPVRLNASKEQRGVRIQAPKIGAGAVSP